MTIQPIIAKNRTIAILKSLRKRTVYLLKVWKSGDDLAKRVTIFFPTTGDIIESIHVVFFQFLRKKNSVFLCKLDLVHPHPGANFGPRKSLYCTKTGIEGNGRIHLICKSGT